MKHTEISRNTPEWNLANTLRTVRQNTRLRSVFGKVHGIGATICRTNGFHSDGAPAYIHGITGITQEGRTVELYLVPTQYAVDSQGEREAELALWEAFAQTVNKRVAWMKRDVEEARIRQAQWVQEH